MAGRMEVFQKIEEYNIYFLRCIYEFDEVKRFLFYEEMILSFENINYLVVCIENRVNNVINLKKLINEIEVHKVLVKIMKELDCMVDVRYKVLCDFLACILQMLGGLEKYYGRKESSYINS